MWMYITANGFLQWKRCENGRQLHRSNVPVDSPSSYYKKTITIPLLDHRLTEMNDRFSSHHPIALQGSFLVPSILITLTEDDSKLRIGKLALCTKKTFLLLTLFSVNLIAGI